MQQIEQKTFSRGFTEKLLENPATTVPVFVMYSNDVDKYIEEQMMLCDHIEISLIKLGAMFNQNRNAETLPLPPAPDSFLSNYVMQSTKLKMIIERLELIRNQLNALI